MEILFILIVVYCIHLVDKHLDKRSAEKFVDKICGNRRRG